MLILQLTLKKTLNTVKTKYKSAMKTIEIVFYDEILLILCYKI